MNPAVYFFDMDTGPCVIAGRGLETCGWDLRTSWETVNTDAAVVARTVFYHTKRQWHLWLATGDSETPAEHFVLNTQHMRDDMDGKKKGWAVWTGPSSNVLSVCLFSNNIDADAARSHDLVPFIAKDGDGLIWRMENGDDDNGTEYTSSIMSRPFLHNNLLDQFETEEGVLFAKAQAGATVSVTVIGDLNRDSTLRKSVTAVLDPESSEEYVIRVLDHLGCAELRTVQVRFEDAFGASPSTRWELSLLALKETVKR
jgi:hypothetical protein